MTYFQIFRNIQKPRLFYQIIFFDIGIQVSKSRVKFPHTSQIVENQPYLRSVLITAYVSHLLRPLFAPFACNLCNIRILEKSKFYTLTKKSWPEVGEGGVGSPLFLCQLRENQGAYFLEKYLTCFIWQYISVRKYRCILSSILIFFSLEVS